MFTKSLRALTLFFSVLIISLPSYAGSKAKSKIDTFTGQTVIYTPTARNHCSFSECVGFGAQWNSGAPDLILVSIYVLNQTTPLDKAMVKIGDDIITLEPTPNLTYYGEVGASYNKSVKDYIMKRDDFERMISTDGSLMRVYSLGGGYFESAVIRKGKKSLSARYSEDLILAIQTTEPTKAENVK